MIAESKEKQILKIEKLYTFLSSTPAFIDATKEEFYNAFTGQEIKEGIKWSYEVPPFIRTA